MCVESVTAMMLIPLVTGEIFMETPASATRGTVMQHMTATQMTSAQVSKLCMVKKQIQTHDEGFVV